MSLKKLFFWPSKNLTIVIPIILVLGFIVGYLTDTTFLKAYILPGTVLMIYPTLVGFKLKEAFDFSHGKVVLTAMIINFTAFPLVAYGLGVTFFSTEPQLFAGLAIASLLPTSGMTISWTMLNKGNVPGAVKITALSLLAGSLLAPWYLLAMVGQMVEVDVLDTFMKIIIIVVIPMILGSITYRYLMSKMTQKEFKENVKPYFPAFSVWALLSVIFVSISMKAKMIMSNPEIIVISLLVLVIFYTVNYFISTIVGRFLMDRENGITLVYGTVMRNLSLCLGLALTTFGPKAGLIITLAYILQVQSAAAYGKISDRYGFFKEGVKDLSSSS